MKPVLPIALALALAFGVAACAEDISAREDAPQSTASPQVNIRDIAASEVDELLEGEDGAVVLDVRTVKEFEAGHMTGAVSIDFLGEGFVQVLTELDRDTTYILHCKSGSRSTKALEVMKEKGFTSVAHLTVGYDGWKAAQEQNQEAQ